MKSQYLSVVCVLCKMVLNTFRQFSNVQFKAMKVAGSLRSPRNGSSKENVLRILAENIEKNRSKEVFLRTLNIVPIDPEEIAGSN